MSDYETQIQDRCGVSIAVLEQLTDVVTREARENGNDSPVDYGDAQAIVIALLTKQRELKDGINNEPTTIKQELTDVVDSMESRVPYEKQVYALMREDEAVLMMKKCFHAGKIAGSLRVRAELMHEFGDIIKLIGTLSAEAQSTSKASSWLAQAKSLRQADNPEGRTDLYSFEKPSETTPGKAVIMLTRMMAIAFEMNEAEMNERLSRFGNKGGSDDRSGTSN